MKVGWETRLFGKGGQEATVQIGKGRKPDLKSEDCPLDTGKIDIKRHDNT